MKKLVMLFAIACMLLVACSDDSGNNSGSNDFSQDIPLCESCEYGSLTDARDGQKYRTVKIGAQWWMAENLNFAYNQPTEEFDSSSVCIDNYPENCKKYGRFYMWSAAMDSVGLFSTNGLGCGKGNVLCGQSYPVRGVCPEGWHLPSDSEIKTLFISVGGSPDENGEFRTSFNEGSKLALCREKNPSGFAAIPIAKKGGGRICDNNDKSELIECKKNFFYFRMDKRYEDDEKNASDFWSSLSIKNEDGDGGYFFSIRCYDDYAAIEYARVDSELKSVRCVKD